MSLKKSLKKRADYIHPVREWWGAGHLVAGVYPREGEIICECCSMHYATTTTDNLCDECDELCRGKEWCPV